MEYYLKKEKVVCNFEKACRRKSKGFCRDCTRNFSTRRRDWFEPTENHKRLLEIIRGD